MASVVVVGAGIAGLAAADLLSDEASGGHEVVVLEAADQVGGKLRSGAVAGVVTDVGAEAMLRRRPEGVALAERFGLEVVAPATTASRLWLRDGLHPLPRSLMGVPMDLDDLARADVLSPAALDRVRRELTLPPEAVETGEDISVGDLVDARLGPEVTDLLVEPLLGGVYAGNARVLSARAAVPQLLQMAAQGSLVAQAATLAPTPGVLAPPVFAGLCGGLAGLPARMADVLAERGVALRLATAATGLRRHAEGYEVATADGPIRADAVVVALPAPAAAALLRAEAQAVASELAAVEVADVAVLSFAFPADAVAHLDGSGFLVPPNQGRGIKAATFSFNKWAWVRESGGDVAVLRASMGRAGEQVLAASDADLLRIATADLVEATGVRASALDTHVQRWPAALPQYAVGHVDRVRRIRRGLRRIGPLAVAGAAYDGVGVPAVIASAQAAVRDLASRLDAGGDTMAP